MYLSLHLKLMISFLPKPLVTILCILFCNKWIDFTVLCCAACQSVQSDSCQSLTRKVLWDSLVRKELVSLCVVTLASRSSGTLHFFSLFPCEVMRVVPRMCKLQKRGESLLNTQRIVNFICFCCVSTTTLKKLNKNMAKVLRKAFSASLSEEVWKLYSHKPLK